MPSSFWVENLRAIRTCDPIEIKPITLFVGKNSCGKSSLLRVLPLIRQSVETPTTGPVLWWGDLVDFGDFSDVVNKNSLVRELTIGFRLRVAPEQFFSMTPFWGRRASSGYRIYDTSTDKKVFDVEVGLVESSKKFTVASKISVACEDYTFEVQFSPAQEPQQLEVSDILINGDRVIGMEGKPLLESVRFSSFAGSIFPIVYSRPKAQTVRRQKGSNSREQVHSLPELIFFNELDLMLHGRGDTSFVLETAARVLASRPGELRHAFELCNSATIFQRSLQERLEDPNWLSRMHTLHVLHWVGPILQTLDNQLSLEARNITYTGPFRALPQRFYRAQDLRVDVVAPNGSNLAMFLWSLSAADRRDFSNLMQQTFGFEIDVQKNDGLVRIRVGNGDNHDNLIDVGFGISQLLPVLAQAWNAGRVRRRSRFDQRRDDISRIVALEQPELHLHPAHQAALGDALITLALGDHLSQKAKKERNEINFVVETHSPHLINTIGHAVRNGRIKNSDVRVYRFQSAQAEEGTEIFSSEFDDNGVLQNWPYGFFSA